MRPIRVLSLFDGMSCGQIALRDLGFPIEVYYASEIDKFAIQQTQLNFPDTVQLGDVRNIDVDKLCDEVGEFDLLLAGSPCTNLSTAGNRAGLATKENIAILTLGQYIDLKEAGFEFEGQSYLFWEFMRILTALRRRNPNIMFLLENVEMGKKWESVLSDAIGIRGVHINSALVSAQNRKRIYWSNIRVREEGLFGYIFTDIPQPADRGILLRDILEKEVDERYFLSDKMLAWLQRHSEKLNHKMKLLGEDDKTKCVTSTAAIKTNLASNFVCVAMRGQNPKDPSSRETGIETVQMLEPAEEGKTNCLTSVEKDNLILANNHLQKNLTDVDSKANAFLATSHKGAWANGMSVIVQRGRGKNQGGFFSEKSPTLTSHRFEYNNHVLSSYRIRRLTPTECARLQTIPDWYKWECSATQQYRLLGDGWTVEVIKHILSFMRLEDTV